MLKRIESLPVTAKNPGFSLLEDLAATSAFGTGVFLQALNCVGQNREHQFHFRQQVISPLECS
jgi:hypothetical protein